MKMNRTLYLRLNEALLAALAKEIGTIGFDKLLADYGKSGLSKRRLYWDMFAAACRFDGGLCNALYNGGLNDSHIETALKRIIV